MTSLAYPLARRDDATDDDQDHLVGDPCRELEEADSAVARQAHNAVTNLRQNSPDESVSSASRQLQPSGLRAGRSGTSSSKDDP